MTVVLTITQERIMSYVQQKQNKIEAILSALSFDCSKTTVRIYYGRKCLLMVETNYQ